MADPADALPHILWKGYLKLSLVSCAVAVVPAATGTATLSLTTLNGETGHRVRRRYVDSVTGEPVEREDQAKGYPVAKDRYVLIEDEEIDRIAPESAHTIDVRLFVPAEEIDPVWKAASHYIVPDDPVAVEAYAVIREAMAQEGVVGIGRVVLQRRERRCVLEPCGRGILMTTLHYPYEIRDAKPVFDAIPEAETPKQMLDMAARIIEAQTGPFEPDAFEDRYNAGLTALAQAKAGGKAPPKTPKAPEPGKVINLMDALKRSIDAEKKAAGKPAAKAPAERTRKKTPSKTRQSK